MSLNAIQAAKMIPVKPDFMAPLDDDDYKDEPIASAPQEQIGTPGRPMTEKFSAEVSLGDRMRKSRELGAQRRIYQVGSL